MKVTTKILSAYLFLNFLFFDGSLFSDTSKVHLENSNDTILWVGYGCPLEFDSSTIKDSEKKEAFKKGLTICEEKARNNDCDYQAILAEHLRFPLNIF